MDTKTKTDLLPPKGINENVRKFSKHMIVENPTDQLVIALADREAKDEEGEKKIKNVDQQWKSMFVRGTVQHFETEEETRLEEASQDLVKAWESFLKYVPKEHRARYAERSPNLEDVAQAVASANSMWKEKQKTKTGKAKTLFANLCQTLQDYKQVMAPIPSQDKYISLLTGSFSVVVFATLNHKKIAEGVSSCLEGLGDNIDFWKRQLDTHNENNFMKRYVAQLYVLVFQLLVDIMQWFNSGLKRFTGAFDEDGFSKLVSGKTDKMKALEQKLGSEAKLAAEDNIKKLVANQPTTKELFAMVQGFQAILDARLEAGLDKLGRRIQSTMRDAAKTMEWQLNNNGVGADIQMSSVVVESASRGPQKLMSSTQTYTKAQLQASSLHLQIYQQKETVARLASKSQLMDVNVEVLRRMKSLLSISSTPQSLWISGPFQVPIPSQVTLTAANLSSAAHNAGIPVLTYFCQRTDTVGHNTVIKAQGEMGTKGVGHFVYSLISQLVDFIPADIIQTAEDFSTGRFKLLDGRIESLPSAVLLLRDILVLGPALLFCFFDSLQLLKPNLTKVEAKALGDVIRMFRNTKDASTENKDQVIKVLYTTDGFFDLLGQFSGQERLTLSDYEYRPNGHRRV